MKAIHLIFFLIPIALCACSGDQYDPSKHLSAHEKDVIVTSIARYVVKLPKGATDSTKFDTKYNSYYEGRIGDIKLERFYPRDSVYFFLISQRAPSLTDKRHATGGKFILDSNGNMVHYEEMFRTWKMVADTLQTRSYLLFDKMVKDESLEPYLTRNSPAVEFIEFPDDRTFYDTGLRKWQFSN
jgi:hypothetical protein